LSLSTNRSLNARCFGRDLRETTSPELHHQTITPTRVFLSARV
jgi:hypothetical protein